MNRMLLIFFLIPIALVAQDVTIHVIDRNGAPVEDAEVSVFYERIGKLDSSQTRVGKTDEDGVFKSSGSAELCLFFTVEHEGYYDYGKLPAKKDELCGRPEKVEKIIQISKKIDPTALYGTFHGGGTIPELSEWCGYDMQERDWVAPYGEGKVADLVLRLEREFLGLKDSRHSVEVLREAVKGKYERLGKEFNEDIFKLEVGKWDIRLEVAFANEKEGLVKVVEEFKPHSVLHMPHKAPEEGYQKSYEYSVNNYEPYTLKDDLGFFIRTRVVLDEDGNIESANYAKIHGDFKMHQNGGIGFTYYFNPVPNDRNLEFDPKQNLFPEGAPGTFNFVLP